MQSPDTPDPVGAALARLGLKPNAADAAWLRGVYQRYVERVDRLHAADLNDEEVAGLFEPDGPTPR